MRYYRIKVTKNKMDYGFIKLNDNNELYTDYNFNNCSKFNSFNDVKPIINRLIIAGFKVILFGPGHFNCHIFKTLIN